MKFVSVVLFALLAGPSVLALPAPEPFILGAVGSLTQKAGDFAQGVVTGSTGLANGIVGGVSGAVQGGIDVGANVAKGVAGAVTGVVTGTITTGGNIAKGVIGGVTGAVVQSVNSVQKITQAIKDCLKNTITSATSSTVRGAATAFGKLAEQLQGSAEQLLEAAEQKMSEVEGAISAEAEKEKDRVNNFAIAQQDKAASASAATQATIQQKLDAFATDSNNKINACAQGIIAPVEALSNQARESYQNSLPLIQDVLDKIQECASMNQRNFASTRKCAEEIKQKSEALKPIPGQFTDLLRQLARSSSATALRSPCILTVRTSINSQMAAMTAEFDLLIKNDQAQAARFRFY